MPNKTIYVSDDDLPLYAQAAALAGGKLSAAITAALKKYVEAAAGPGDGLTEITVRVGPGRGRLQRFTGVLLGEWGHATAGGHEMHRVYRSRKGRYVVHVERSKTWTPSGPKAAEHATGWRGWAGDWSAEQSWTVTPAGKTLQVVDTLEELATVLPPDLYEIVLHDAGQPVIEDLDI